MFELSKGLVGLLHLLKILISLQQLEERETFLTQSRYEVAQGHHASHKILDVFHTGRSLHSSDG